MASTRTIPIACALLATALSACGSQQNLGGNYSWNTSGSYPAGPYGINVGDTLPNFEFPDGWVVNPPAGTTATDGNKQTISMSMFYKSNIRWLLIDQSAGWCIPCQMEQTNLLDYADPTNPTFGGHHIGVLEMLEENDNEQSPSVPGVSFTENWINSFNLYIPVIGDDTQAAYSLLTMYFPTNTIIDTSTMKIVYKLGGDDPTAIKTEMCTLAGISPCN